MKRFDILRTVTFLILAYGIFSGNSCFNKTNTEADNKCGESTVWKHTFEPDAYHDNGVGADGYREYRYEILTTPEDICPEEHIKVLYLAHLDTSIKKAPESLSIRGYAYWSLFGRSTPMPVSFFEGIGDYEAKDEIGLKQAFPSGPGYIGLQILVRFPSKGSGIYDDLAYVDSLFESFYISCTYRTAL